MTLSITLKRYTDKEESQFDTQWESMIQFFKDLKKHKFASLEGRLVSGKLEKIDILKIVELNYHHFDDKEKVFYIEVENEGGEIEVLRSSEVDDNFEDESKDITTNMILKYYHNKMMDPTIEIENIIYDSESKNLLIGENKIFIGGDNSYAVLVRYIIENMEDSIFISELSEYYHELDETTKKQEKTIRNSLNHFHTITKEMTGGKRILRTDGFGKLLYNIPIIQR